MSAPEPILYSFRRCPFAMRARMALDAAGIDVEHREVVLSRKPAAMLAASPKGTVPVLVLPDGHVIDESLDIMDWALERADPDGWAADGQRHEAERFLADFKDALDRYKYASRYDEAVPRGAVNLAERKRAMTRLKAFTEPLDRSKFLRGDTAQYLDIATFPFIRQFAAVEPEWWSETASDGLQAWLTTLTSSPRFKRIMVKHPEWDKDVKS